jgi:flagellin-like protein
MEQQRAQSAVSPVIGVILMVAVTVILAAVIGNLVLGLGEEVEKTPQAGVSFDEEPRERLRVTVVKPNGIDKLIVVADSASTVSSDGLGSGEIKETHSRIQKGFFDSDIPDNRVVLEDPKAGDTITILACGQSDPPVIEDHATVIGVLDGNEAVLRTYEVSRPIDVC